MSVAQAEASAAVIHSREEKLQWLVRPLVWAYYACMIGIIFAALMWLDGKIEPEIVSVIALTSLAVAAALLLWGTRRVLQAGRSRL